MVFGEGLRRTERRTSNRKENFKTSVLGLRSELWGWYASRRQSHTTEKLTQVVDVTPSLIRQHGRSKIKDEGRRHQGNVVVLGALLEALIQMVKFARC